MLPPMLGKLFKWNSLLYMALIPLNQILMAKLQWTMLCKCCTPCSRLVKNTNILANNCISYCLAIFWLDTESPLDRCLHLILSCNFLIVPTVLHFLTRKEIVPIDLCIFFPALHKPTYFHWNYELWQPDFSEKLLNTAVNLFHNNVQVWYLLIKFCQRKIVKVYV